MDKQKEKTDIQQQEEANQNKLETPMAKTKKWAFENKSLLVLTILFTLVLLGSWGFAIKLQQTVAANGSVQHADSNAIIEVERLRNLASAQIDNSRAFFLLGSQSLFEKQKAERSELMKALSEFEEKYNLPEVPAQTKRIRDAVTKTQDFFEQGMEFRQKQTESKIVGQFFQSKTNPIRTEINDALDDIVKIHQADINRRRAEVRSSYVGAENQIPQGMTWLTASLAVIFLAMAFLVIRLVRKQAFQIAQQNRLYEEAKKAVQDRDEAIFAISHDLKESLDLISNTAEQIKHPTPDLSLTDAGDLVKSTVVTIEGLIKDIRDHKNAALGAMTLRLDQLSIDQVLDEARLLMQPLAKQHDVRLQIDKVNPPVLAFYDNERVLRVLSNLLNNAIKFSPKGEKVVVKVRSDQKFVNISVIDSGSGIPASQLGGIFDNFWQAKKTAEQGAGVGLAVAKTIVEAHGGTIEVNSQSGRGTTVTFSLPRRRPVGASIKKPSTQVRTGNPTPDWHL